IVTLSATDVSDVSPIDEQAGFTYSYACDSSIAYDALNIEFSLYECSYTEAGIYQALVKIIDKDGGEQNYGLDIAIIASGDCNADMTIDADDLSALQLEIFDDDSANSFDDIDNGYSGNPIGCDANADSIIDAGDLSCVQAMIFDEDFVCIVEP
ncbi:MAG: hypothetical protein WBC91_25315, partial [Phototrophicaceae bacterium]